MKLRSTKSSRGTRPTRPRGNRPTKPILEPLEGRTLLTGYTFTKITDAATSPFRVPSDAAINDHGDVAFSANSSDGSAAIWASRGGVINQIDQASTGTLQDVSINDSGLVAYAHGGVLPYSIMTGDGTTKTTIATTDDGNWISVDSPVVNNAGEVAFHGIESASGGGLSGIFLYDGGVISPLALDSVQYTTEPPFGLNNPGQAAYHAENVTSDKLVVSGGPTIEQSGSQFLPFNTP